MQLGFVPPPHHGHHGGHRGFIPGWWGADGYLTPQTTIYEVQQQDLRPLYFIGGVALLGLLVLARR